MEDTQKIKTFKVRRKINPKANKSTPTKKITIARKIKPDDYKFPIPNTIQEDLLLESEDMPTKFLTNFSSNPRLEVINYFSGSLKKESLYPTSVIGSYDNFRKRERVETTSLLKSIVKFQPYSNTNALKKPISMDFLDNIEDLDSKIKAYKEKVKLEKKPKEKSHKKVTPGMKIILQKQSKSLENYNKHKKYWERLETNMGIILEKDPKELTINSSRPFIAKQKEFEIIESIRKKNIIQEKSYWVESLRKDSKPFHPNGKIIPVETKSKPSMFNKDSIGYASTPQINKRSTKEFFNFHDFLNKNNSNTEEILNYADGQELAVNGLNKIQLEYEAAKKVDPRLVRFNPIENDDESIIESKYDSNLLY
jgi:MYCBP-associated protein family